MLPHFAMAVLIGSPADQLLRNTNLSGNALLTTGEITWPLHLN